MGYIKDGEPTVASLEIAIALALLLSACAPGPGKDAIYDCEVRGSDIVVRWNKEIYMVTNKESQDYKDKCLKSEQVVAAAKARYKELRKEAGCSNDGVSKPIVGDELTLKEVRQDMPVLPGRYAIFDVDGKPTIDISCIAWGE